MSMAAVRGLIGSGLPQFSTQFSVTRRDPLGFRLLRFLDFLLTEEEKAMLVFVGVEEGTRYSLPTSTCFINLPEIIKYGLRPEASGKQFFFRSVHCFRKFFTLSTSARGNHLAMKIPAKDGSSFRRLALTSTC